MILGTHKNTDYGVDWWALGVILFEFIVGTTPFNDESADLIFNNIINLRIPWGELSSIPEEEQMSSEAKDLIQKLLVLDPEKRLGFHGSKEIKNHPFFDGYNFYYFLI